MRLVDVTLALPFLPLMIVLGVFLGPGLDTLILVIAVVIWAGTARELRAQVLSARERDHVQAARAMGASGHYVLSRHLLREVTPLVVPEFVLAAKTAVLAEATLAFLGLGDAGAKSWGTMLSFAHARNAFLTDAWLWWVLPPGLCIAATILAFALIGYGLEERARPQLRHRPEHPRRFPHFSRPRRGALPAPATSGTERPLVVEDLSVAYRAGGNAALVVAVDGVSLSVDSGETLGLVGESGSGKTTLACAASGMLPPTGTVTAGRVLLDGRNLADLPPTAVRRLRGDRVALLPQDALHALNPVFRVRNQIAEAVTVHGHGGRRQALRRADRLLDLVGVDPPRGRDYPHQFSGGMRQRAVIATALANDPSLLIADEPTSGLDVIGQAEILTLLADLQRRWGLAMLVVSHNLPVVLTLADRLAVMRHGRILEQGPAGELAARPTQAHTRRLLEATPRLRIPTSASVSDREDR